MTDEYAEVFKEETYEILEELERSLLDLENAPEDADLIARIFRAIHTIKGSGAMFGFDMISSFAHEIENAFDLLREGEIKAGKPLIDITLRGMDFIKIHLESENLDEESKKEKEFIEGVFREIMEKGHEWVPLKELQDASVLEKRRGGESHQSVPSPEKTVDSPTMETSPEETDMVLTGGEMLANESYTATPEPSHIRQPEKMELPETGETTYRIHFSPSPDILQKGTDVSQLLKDLSLLGNCHIVAHLKDIPLLDQLDPYRCYVHWDIILTTNRGKNAVQDVFIFLEDQSQARIDRIDSGDSQEPQDYKTVGNILVEKGAISIDEINAIIASKKRIGEMLVEEGAVELETLESALVEQQHVREVRKKRQETETATSLRVSSEKVDLLVNLVGELVTLQARLSQISHKKKDPELLSLSEEVERITWELRDNSMDMRMLPIGSTFSRFKRLVRDLSNNLGKEVELFTEGGDTELDKTVIEKLNDPLVHIIRNSIDHGVEIPDVRLAAGKPKKGSVTLTAFHSGYNVVIQITDDGAGLDTDKIKKKAIERGIIAADKELSPKEIYPLIFEPGFSTAAAVSDVSGRGVGMDVVRRNIEALRGFIEIDSELGIGTTFTLKIPLTLAIIDGLLVEIGAEKFVLPLSLVESCIEVPHSVLDGARRQYINVRGELIPYIYLREEFSINNKIPEIEQIVIAAVEKYRVGFVVDHVVGDHQTVIKSLGRVYKNVEGISGATILGDGSVALILDITKLVQKAILEAENIGGNLQSAAL